MDIWTTIAKLFASQHPWSAFIYLLLGAMLGALVSIYATVRAQRPRLIISGHGSGGSRDRHHWSINIANRPTFLGIAFVGEAARDLQPWIRLAERDSRFYHLQWANPQAPQQPIMLEPGQSHSISLFSWQAGTRGYCIVDASGEPVARFEARQLRFILRINDRLGRMKELSFTVQFDDSHLKNAPQLRLLVPPSLEERGHMFRNGLRELLSAFRSRR